MKVPFFSFDFDNFQLLEREEDIQFRHPAWHRSPIKAIKWARRLIDQGVREKYAALADIEKDLRVEYLDENNRLKIPGMM